jgi:pimeloyl-ACP methyl ester carboxylesterase
VRVLVEGSLDRAVALFGSSADPDPELTWARGITLLAGDGGVAANHAGPIAVVGRSTAGLEALAFAARHARLVDRVALVATPIPADVEALGFALSDVTAKSLLLVPKWKRILSHVAPRCKR